MKRIIICCLLIAGAYLHVFPQFCTPDSSQTEFGIYPSDSSGLSQGCFEELYSDFVTVVVPDSVQVLIFNVAIDSVSLNSVDNLPPGLSYVCNPSSCVFPGNSIGCVSLFGTPTVGGTFAVTASVTVFTSFGTLDTSFAVGDIIINEPPQLAFSYDTVCAGETTTVTNLSTGVDAGATYYLDLGNDGSIELSVPASALPADSTFVIAGPGTVTFSVVVVNSTGCSDTLVATVTTPPAPELAFAIDTVCFGENTTVTNLSTGVDAGATYYLDIDNDGTIDLSAPASALPTDSSFNIGATGTFDFRAIVVNSTGCSDTLVSTVTVHDQPQLAFSYDTVCAGETTTVTNLSTGVDAGATYYLDLGNDGSIELSVPASALPADSTFVIAGPGALTFSVVVVNSTGCSDTLVATVTTPPAPQLAFAIDTVCFGENTTVTNLSTGVDAGATYYLDIDNDGTIDLSAPASALPTDSSFNIGATGTFDFRAIVVNSTGCSDTLVSTVTVHDQPELAFSYDTVCAGETTTVTNLSTGVDAGATYYLDLGNDGSIELSVPASALPADSTFVIAGPGALTFSVVVVNSTGCSDTLVATVTTPPAPQLAFAIDTVCFGENTTVTNLSTGVDAGATYYLDIDNDGTIDLSAPASALPTDSSFNIGATGTFDFRAIVVNSTGCSDTLVSTVTVHDQPELAFSYDTVCAGETTTVTNLSTGVDAGATYYLDLGNDGSIELSVPASALPADSTFVIAGPGALTFSVVVVNSTGCSDTLVATVTTPPAPQLAFAIDTVCFGENTTVTNLSTGVDAGATYYLDIDNDGTIDLSAPASALPTDSSFNIGATGTFDFRAIVVNSTGCSDTLVSTVTVFGQPELAFTADTVCFGENTTVTNLSTGVDAGATYYLDIDNDGTIDLSAPAAALPTDSSFIIGASGTFDFRVVVVNSTGCTDTFVSTITIYEQPKLAFGISESCFGDTTLITNLSTGVDAGATYFLDINSDGSIDLSAPAASLPSDSSLVIPISGDIAFTVIVVNSTGCTDTMSSLIKVTDCNDGDPCTVDSCANGACFYIPIPNCGGCDSTTISVSIEEPTGTFCQGDSIRLEAVSPTLVTYEWSTGATTATINAAPNTTYSVTVTDTSGCEASDTITTGNLSSGLSSYLIIAEKDVDLKMNTVLNGGIGVTQAFGKAKFSNGTVVTAPSTFVRADKITVSGGSVVTTQIPSAANVTLPTFEFNTFCNTGVKVHTKDNTVTTLTGAVYNDVTVGKNSTVIFTQPSLDIENIHTKDNATIKFTAPCVKIRICKKFWLGKDNTFNPDTADVVLYIEQDVVIHDGTNLIADIYMNGGKMKVKKATAANPNTLMGMFIVNMLEAEDFTFWNWNLQCDDACTVKDSIICSAGDRRVVSFTLLDSDNDTDIGPLNDGDVIDLAGGNISVRANVCADANIESVKFMYDGMFRHENTAPYTLAGDNNGDYQNWHVLPGVHTIQAIPYSQNNATGIAGADLTITITIVNSALKTSPFAAAEPLKIDEAVQSEMLLNAYPNPFTEKLNIDFMVPVTTSAKLEVFSVSGQRLAVLFEGEADAGKMYRAEFVSDNFTGNMVIYRLQTESGSWFNKAVIAR